MTPRYQPKITIGKKDIAPSWDGKDIAALDALSLVWGKPDLYARVQTATATIRVIDPDGQWATSNDLIGNPVTIARPGRRMFRGEITNSEVTLINVIDPITGNKRTAWLATLATVGVLGQLDRIVTVGPGTDPAVIATYGVGYWPHAAARNRVPQIMAAGADQYVNAIELIGGDPPGGFARTVAPHFRSEQISLLGLIERLYALEPLAHVNYNAHTNEIELGHTAPSSGLVLTLDAGVIELTPLSGFSLPAELLINSSIPTVSSTVSEAIEVIDVLWWSWYLNTVDLPSPIGTVSYLEFVEEHTQVSVGVNPADRPSRRTLSVTTDAYPPTAFATDPLIAQTLGEMVASMVAGVNGRFTPPSMRFDFRRFDLGDSVLDELLLDTMDHPEPLYFPGSMFNQFHSAGPQFQLVGATLTWYGKQAGSELDAGWVLDMTLAPTTGVLDTVTIEELVTNTSPTLDAFNHDITLAELGYVTEGLI